MGLKPIYQEIFELAKPYLRTRKNLIHTRTALRYAIKLLQCEEGDEEVVIPAILLHDVGWKVVPVDRQMAAFGPNPSNPELTKVHEIEGAKVAAEILKKLYYPAGKREEIRRIVRGHDTRKKPISRNDRIVRDSDKLWRFSREGLPVETSRFRMSRTDWLGYVESKIEQWFFLRAARQLARDELNRRRQEMRRVRE